MKRGLLIVILLATVFLSVIITTIRSQEISLQAKKIDYPLPYPGILPDHPLYFIKILRDKMLLFFTRDALAKAELYLLSADKRAQMARELSQKGRWELAAKTIEEGEEFFSDIPNLIAESKRYGISPGEDFILKLKLSNQKHQEVIENLLKEIPQGQRAGLENILRQNAQIKEKLSAL